MDLIKLANQAVCHHLVGTVDDCNDLCVSHLKGCRPGRQDGDGMVTVPVRFDTVQVDGE